MLVSNFFLTRYIGTLHYGPHIIMVETQKDDNSETRKQTNNYAVTSLKEHKSVHIPYFGVRYSNFRCVGDNNNVKAFDTRSCVWMNVCYDTQKRDFLYYQKEKRPVLFDKNIGPISTFRYDNKGFVTLSRWLFHLDPFGPAIVYENPPSDEAQVHRLKNVHVIWKHSSQEFSLGHVLFEDFATIFYSFARLGTNRENSVLMHKYGVPNNIKFEKMERGFRPAITGNPSVSMNQYLHSFNKRFVCFDYLQASSPIIPFDPIAHSWNHGKEDLFYSFRNAILLSHDLDPEKVPTRHKIIITNKQRSNFKAGRKRIIANIDQLANFLKQEYPSISVEIVEWDLLPIKGQLEKILDSTILITPCGGVSFIMPFLPNGAHAIVMDYFSDVKFESWRGVEANQSTSMEGAFWNHWWHFKTLYYQVWGPSDWEWDFPNAWDTRQDASIIIKEERIKELINTALEQME